MAAAKVIERDHFDELLRAIARRGYTIVGPTVREQAIVYDEISSAGDLPIGWTDEQDGGHYRLRRRNDEALFGYAVGPHSWKQYQLPAEVKLWRARVDERGALVDAAESPSEHTKYAFIGARSCELHAIGILDRVLTGGRRSDPGDAAHNVDVFIVAFQCGVAGGTCFCVSMNTGPVAERGFDLALTEILSDTAHHLVVEVGSERGAEVLADVPHRDATGGDREAASSVHDQTASEMGRELDTTEIRELLYGNFEHPRWDEVADRCLSCGNCTMVCPTCFCTTVEDVTDLQGEHVERY
jgi:sulfhydrogenase subunit beta (sulfur reductase)